ncbi:MAG: Clp1/GlmU family protein [Candidatus Njordarchaeales archaeon]
MEAKLRKGQRCLIRGISDGSIIIRGGLLEIFGAIIGAEKEVRVPRGRVLPTRVLEDTTLLINGCEISNISNELFPEEWYHTITLIEEQAKRVKPLIISVLGYTDVGKSSFILLATNILVNKGLKIGICDADIGQSKIGPPGVIGAAVISKQLIDLTDLPMKNGYFVGDKTPEGHLLPCIVGVSKMISFLRERSDIIFIDTTGMIYGGPARALKLYKMEIIKPKIVIILERERESEHLSRMLRHSVEKIIRLPAPKTLKTTGRELRIALRSYSFQKFIEKVSLKTLELDINTVSFQECVFGSGYPLENPAKIFEDNTILWAEISPDVFLIITREPKHVQAREELITKARRLLVSIKTIYIASKMKLTEEIIRKSPILSKMDLKTVENIARIIFRRNIQDIRIQIIPKSTYNNLYVGLLDENGELLGVGILKDIDFQARKLKVKAAYIHQEREPSIIKMGYLRLNDDWIEIGKRRIGVG